MIPFSKCNPLIETALTGDPQWANLFFSILRYFDNLITKGKLFLPSLLLLGILGIRDQLLESRDIFTTYKNAPLFCSGNGYRFFLPFSFHFAVH